MQKWKFIISFKGVDNCRSMKQSKFTDQPKITCWSLQKSSSIMGSMSQNTKKTTLSLLLFRVFRIMRTSIVQIVRPMSPKHEKTTLFPLLWCASEIVFHFFAQAHLLTTLRQKNNASVDCRKCAIDDYKTRKNNALASLWRAFRNFFSLFRTNAFTYDI